MSRASRLIAPQQPLRSPAASSLLRAAWKLVEASTGVRPFLEYESQFSRYAVQSASPPCQAGVGPSRNVCTPAAP